MKKIYSLILAISAVATLAISCSNDKFAELYPDPSKTSVVTCDKLMTGTFIAGNQNTFNSYWRMYTWDNYFGKLAQTIGFSNNSGSVYYINDGYANDRWNNFYDILRNFRVLENTYNNEEAADQAQDKIFMDITEIFVIDHLTQLCDIWGPVPFSEACFLGLTGEMTNAYAAYDSDETLYSNALSRLDAIYTELGSLKGSISSNTQAKLTAADFINKGDIEKWQRYCNTLMLRLGIHVAAQGSLASAGKSAVSTAAGRLLVSDNDNEIFVKSDNDGFQQESRDSWKDINNTANQAMIDAMQITGENDPRLPVFYAPTKSDYTAESADDISYKAGEYFGRSTKETDAQQNVRGGSNHNTEATRLYARLNGYTYTSNSFARSPIITASEAWFLLAEAYQQGYASGDAKAAFINGVVCSINFYYRENMESDQTRLAIYSDQAEDFKAEAMPAESDMKAYAEKVWDAYTNKLEAIMTQKWINFNIKQATQAWTDIRRTGYPALYYPADGADNNGYPTVTQRVKYPATESANNNDNYKAGAALVDNDSAYYTLFWAKKVQ